MAKNLRNTVFWALDFLKGNPIRNHLREIQEINDSEPEQILKYQDRKISDIVSYSKQFVPYYRDSKFEKFDDFPIVNKSIYKDNLEAFLSERYTKESMIRVVTSGSTGTPFVSYQDKNKKNRNTSDAIFFAKLAGYNFGELLFYLKIWSKNNQKSKVIQFIQNIKPVDVLDLTGERVKDFIIELKKRNSIIHINSYYI